jgi:hypothetical protein
MPLQMSSFVSCRRSSSGMRSRSTPSSPTSSGGSREATGSTHRKRRTFATSLLRWMERAPASVDVEAEPHLALAVYREAVNTTSPYFAFFAFWGVLDAVFDGDRQRVNAFVNAAAETDEGIGVSARRVLPEWTLPQDTDVATYLREHGRNAIGHVKRDRDDAPHVDPDDSQTRHRLTAQAYWLRALAKRAVLDRWPEPVRLIG